MTKRKTKADLEGELKQAEKELRKAKRKIKDLEKRNELIWKMHIAALDRLADMRIQDDIRFEYEYEYILSGESTLTEEETEIYLSHNYDRYKMLKRGLIPWKQEWEDASTADAKSE